MAISINVHHPSVLQNSIYNLPTTQSVNNFKTLADDKILHDPKFPEFCVNILYVSNYDDCLYSKKCELTTPVRTRQCYCFSVHTQQNILCPQTWKIFL